MKSTADIFLVKRHGIESSVIKHTLLVIAYNNGPIIAVKIGF